MKQTDDQQMTKKPMDKPMDTEEFEDLFTRVPKRIEPPKDAASRAYETVNQEWQNIVSQRKKRQYQYKTLTGLAVAATLVLSLGINLFWPLSNGISLQLSANSHVFIDGQYLSNKETITINKNQVMRSDQAASLMLGRLNLRLASASKIEWIDHETIRLLQGQIYIDTNEVSNINILTPFGNVTDIGTRFMVELQSQSMQVSVRSGEVMLNNTDNQHTARAKSGLSAVVTVSDDSLEQHYEPNSSSRWTWLHEARTGYTLHRVPALLQKIAEDLGKELLFSSTGVQAAISSMKLDGDLTSATPQEALSIVTQTSNLNVTENDNTIIISFLNQNTEPSS